MYYTTSRGQGRGQGPPIKGEQHEITQLFESRQSDFASSMKLKAPTNISFKDADEPPRLSGDKMEALIAETIARRNFDTTTSSSTSTINTDLNPTKTSTSTRKTANGLTQDNYFQEKRTIRIGEALDKIPFKEVSWADDGNVFSRLKQKTLNLTQSPSSNEDVTSKLLAEVNAKLDLILSRLPDVLKDVVT